MNGYNTEEIRQLDMELSQYDKVLLFADQNIDVSSVPDYSCLSMVLSAANKKILVLSCHQIFDVSEQSDVRFVTEEDILFLKKLYFTYEFSDKFIMISGDEGCFPNIFQFVNAGVLTMEEALKALLH